MIVRVTAMSLLALVFFVSPAFSCSSGFTVDSGDVRGRCVKQIQTSEGISYEREEGGHISTMFGALIFDKNGKLAKPQIPGTFHAVKPNGSVSAVKRHLLAQKDSDGKDAFRYTTFAKQHARSAYSSELTSGTKVFDHNGRLLLLVP